MGLSALGAFPNLAFAVTDKTEVTASAALTERLGADKVGVRQVAVVDDVGVAEHRTEAIKNTVTRKDMFVEALGTLEVELSWTVCV